MPVFALAYLHDALRRARARRGGDRASPICAAAWPTPSCPKAGSAHVEELSDPYLLWFWNSNVRSTAIVLNSLVKAGATDAPVAADGALADGGPQRTAAGATRRRTRYAMEALVAYYRKYESDVAGLPRGGDARRRASWRASSSRGDRPRRRRRRCRWRRCSRRRARGTAQPLDVHARRHRARCSTPRACATPSDALFQQGLDSGFHDRALVRAVRRDRHRARRRRRYKAGDLVRVTLTFRLTKERRFVAVTDPLPAGFEPVESWFATTAASLAREQDDQRRRGSGNWMLVVAARRLRSRRAPRRSRPAVRHAPQRRPPRVQLHRPRHDRRHVPHGAGACRGDVRAGGVRPHGDGGD